MNSIIAIDVFLLDGIFQRVADALTDRVSCFTIAGVFLRAAVICLIIVFVTLIRETYHDPIMVALMIGGFVVFLRLLLSDGITLMVIRRLVHREGTFNPLRGRHLWRFGQLTNWLLQVVMLCTWSDLGTVQLGLFVAMFAWTCALYFMSCQHNPPRSMWQLA